MIRYKDKNGEMKDIAGVHISHLPEGFGVPVGSTFAYISSVVPEDYLLCDGSTFDADTYPELYALLGSNKTPDFREVVLVGAGTNSTDSIATHDTYTFNQFKDDALQSHTHSVQYANGNSGGGTTKPQKSYWKTATTPTATTDGATGRTGTVTRGKRFGVNFIIKAK